MHRFSASYTVHPTVIKLPRNNIKVVKSHSNQRFLQPFLKAISIASMAPISSAFYDKETSMWREKAPMKLPLKSLKLPP